MDTRLLQTAEHIHVSRISSICKPYVIKYPKSAAKTKHRVSIKRLERAVTPKFHEDKIPRRKATAFEKPRVKVHDKHQHRLPKLSSKSFNSTRNSREQRTENLRNFGYLGKKIVPNIAIINRAVTQPVFGSKLSAAANCTQIGDLNISTSDEDFTTNLSAAHLMSNCDENFEKCERWSRSKTEVSQTKVDPKKLLQAIKVCHLGSSKLLGKWKQYDNRQSFHNFIVKQPF